MKRFLLLLLSALLLTGCANQAELPAEPSSEPAQDQPRLISLYDQDSEVERQTGGAVRAYPLGNEEYALVLPMGDGLLAVSQTGTLTLLTGQDGEVAATGKASLARQWAVRDLAVGKDCLLYFDRENRQVVLLDEKLQQLQTVPLPEDSVGDPVLQGSGQIFYCVGSQIRALDIHTGVSRLVREHNCQSQELVGSYFSDAVIGCLVTLENGTQQLLYLSAQNGEVYRRETPNHTMTTYADSYFSVLEEEEQVFVFGSRHSEAMVLLPMESQVVGLPDINCVLGFETGETLSLSLYRLSTGKQTAAVAIPKGDTPRSVAATDGYVWLLCGNVLYRWDTTASVLDKDTVYTQQQFTAEKPDAEGLAQCQERAAELKESYGLNLLFYREGAEIAGERAIAPEYRVTAVTEAMDAIEALLKQFPEGFLKATGDVTFCLVDGLKSGAAWEQYWEGAKCRVLLDSSDPARSFLLGLGGGVDTRVLGNSREFDTWNALNPKKFAYTYDAAENALREDAESYLEYFIDQEAMSYPTVDRSKIFAYAILPENESYFQREGLQDKLQRLCEGIREAYGLEEHPAALAWEQYLERPLYDQ